MHCVRPVLDLQLGGNEEAAGLQQQRHQQSFQEVPAFVDIEE
jgi:hypothetical protein